jgi:hypothetical protein
MMGKYTERDLKRHERELKIEGLREIERQRDARKRAELEDRFSDVISSLAVLGIDIYELKRMLDAIDEL